MILTVTMNPSVDLSYKLDDFILDRVNRISNVNKTPGGKGLNVTRVVSLTGNEVLATGVIGGKLGEYVIEKMEDKNIESDFYRINGETRNCIAILHNGNQTEILESGPTLTDEECENFLSHFKKILSERDISILSISGSLPSGCTADIYKEMISIANKNNIPVVLDTSGQTLLEILEDDELKISIIKPNKEEILEIEGMDTTTEFNDWEEILSNQRYRNVDWVVISLGGKGAYAKHREISYRVNIPKIVVVNPVGSGDATIAGLAVGLLKKMSDINLLKTAMTCGILNTLEDITGHINMDKFNMYFNQIEVTIIN